MGTFVFVFNEETKTRRLCSFDRTWPLLWRMHHTVMSSKLPQRPSSTLRSTGRLTPRNSWTLQVAGSAGFLPVTGGVRQGKTSPQEDRHHGTPDQTKQRDGNQRSNWRQVSSPSSATLGPLTLDESRWLHLLLWPGTEHVSGLPGSPVCRQNSLWGAAVPP